MSPSVKMKSLVKSSACLVKVKLSSFGPVIVQEIWRCDGIFRSPQFFLKPICYSLSKIKRFKKQEVFYASPKFYVHQVEVESFISLSLKLFPSHSLPTHCSGWSKGYFQFLWYMQLIHY
jgi:hypothetical protein